MDRYTIQERFVGDYQYNKTIRIEHSAFDETTYYGDSVWRIWHSLQNYKLQKPM